MSSHGRARWLLIGLLAPVPLLLIGALRTQEAKHVADTDAAPAMVRGDPARGKAIAATCVQCHGADGVSPSAAAPNVAGLSKRAIAKQLVDYRRGARAGKSMHEASARLSDQDIADAAHFAALAAPRYRGTFYPPLPDEIAASLAAHWSASVAESTHPSLPRRR